MDLKNPLFLYIGIPALFALTFFLLFFFRKRKKSYIGGAKAANTEFIKSQSEFKKRRALLILLETIFYSSLIGLIISVLVLTARPFETKNEGGSIRKRDIFLSMDVSYSLYDLNSQVADKLKDVVIGMNGERFGIVIFNTSAVTYVPMTDDYDFVEQRLDELKPYFEAQQQYMTQFGQYSYGFEVPEDEQADLTDILNVLSYYDSGTLTDNTYKGSSLIGVGLASTLYSFPKFGQDDRTRVIILCTDNQEEAITPPEVELDGAAKNCKKRNVRVYGIYANTEYDTAMYGEDYGQTRYNELKKACESTNGEAYEVTAKNTVSDIINDIEAEEAKAVKMQNFVHDIEYPEKPAIFMLIFLIITLATGIVLKR